MASYVYEIAEDEDDGLPYLTISPKSYYEEHGCVYDGSYPPELYAFMRETLQAYEVTDSTFEMPYNMTEDEVRTVLSSCTTDTFEEIVFFPKSTESDQQVLQSVQQDISPAAPPRDELEDRFAGIL